MTTTAQALDRLFRDWLEPADEQPARFTLAAAITTTSQTSFTVDPAFLSPEESALFGPGTVVEIGQEWAQIGLFDEDTNVASACKRGVGGTTAATHLVAAEGKIAPKFGRRSAFDAFADEVVALFPDLSAVTVAEDLTFNASTYTEVAATVQHPMYVWARAVGSSDAPRSKFNVEFFDHFPDSSTGKAITVSGLPNGGSGHLVYRSSFPRPSTEATDLNTTCLLNDEWVRIAIVGAAAQLISAKDLSAAEASFLSEQLAQQNFPVGSGGSVRDSLLRYRQFLLGRAKSAQRGREDTIVTTNIPWG